MKKSFFSIIAIAAILFTACSNGGKKDRHEGHDMDNMGKDSSQHVMTTNDADIKAVQVTFSNVEAKASASLKEIIGHYLHIKNALANDDASEAASGAKTMDKALGSLDKSLLTAEQKKVYDEVEEDLKEHAEHIGKNGDNIKHQREHFSMMSEDVYDIAKAFGGSQPLYHDHCPMYNEDKGGAMWLSEMKEVKNPYFGSQMLKCGTVEEVIK
ncbi:MAG: DUF3347 domain-containing protein [Sphingobacteriales bacterium]|nr:DUF3347 domain-containing protein [Sphingobacteriales bacterium]